MSALDDAIDTLEQRSEGPAVGIAQRARVELAQLRADVARLTRERDEAQKEMSDFDEHHRKVHSAYKQAQAAISEARKVIEAYRALIIGPKGYTSYPLIDQHNAADAWLAAHPAPESLLEEWHKRL